VFAGIALNNFNKRCERIEMTNIAQTVNVLQAMILTDGPDILLTPTYHVYNMYKIHQDAELLPTELTSADYTFQNQSIPALNVSASRAQSGAIHVTLVNADPNNAATVTAELRGATPRRVTGEVLTAPAVNSHNTFENKELVKPAPFTNVKLQGSTLAMTLPSKSVVMLEIQ
jgi:alpha-N-arabinofuranosidase